MNPCCKSHAFSIIEVSVSIPYSENRFNPFQKKAEGSVLVGKQKGVSSGEDNLILYRLRSTSVMLSGPDL